ncbi:MAG: gluconate kinase [Verrucomicrobia bacterium]|nr:MAG: gluconate kinase [Verrucomicrobiota bacterium]
MVVIIWGVAGVGKTTIGELLAQELGWKFYDADDFHSAANIDKMQRGIPLTDEDRQPWLETLRKVIEQSLAENDNAVLACSALKQKYRDRLRVSEQVKFVFLRGSRDRIAEQLKRRRGHFVDPKLLDSQFADLEEPKPSEHAVTVELGDDPPELVQKIKMSLRERSR